MKKILVMSMFIFSLTPFMAPITSVNAEELAIDSQVEVYGKDVRGGSIQGSSNNSSFGWSKKALGYCGQHGQDFEQATNKQTGAGYKNNYVKIDTDIDYVTGHSTGTITKQAEFNKKQSVLFKDYN